MGCVRSHMEQTIDVLAALLIQQAAVQDRIRALEEEKKQILLRGTVEELDKLLNAEQPHLMSSSNLERRRAELQETLGISKADMQRILKEPASEEEQYLAEAYARLKESVERLKKVGDLNGRILQSRIETKKSLLRIFGLDGDVPTYSK